MNARPRFAKAARYNLDNWFGCQQKLIIAPLWVAYQVNLGTLARTCDAVGACLAVPETPHYKQALLRGDTLDLFRPCIHWVAPSKESWLERQRDNGWQTIAVELDNHAIPISKLNKAQQPTIVLLGHEHDGLPDHIIADADQCVQIPMLGVGRSLNVAVAGSLVSYRLAGLL